MKVLVTGATGWLGHASLQAIKKVLPEVKSEDLILYASRARSHSDPSFGVVKVQELASSEQTPRNVDLFISLALKTRDYSMKMDEEEYLESNKALIEKNLQLMKLANPKKIILISSGVVSKYLEGSGPLDPYTEVKILEEKLFNEFAQQTNSKLIVLRLWGATGALMTEPLKYAIGNLIHQAETTNQIIINSKAEVFRRYTDATQIFEVLIRAIQIDYCKTLNSGGVMVEIGSLAQHISEYYEKPLEIVRNLESGSEPDFYVPTDSEFDELANSVGVTLLSLEDQIALTAKSVRQAMEN
jgi:nucleoside-diphosphate-sugar epimerase